MDHERAIYLKNAADPDLAWSMAKVGFARADLTAQGRYKRLHECITYVMAGQPDEAEQSFRAYADPMELSTSPTSDIMRAYLSVEKNFPVAAKVLQSSFSGVYEYRVSEQIAPLEQLIVKEFEAIGSKDLAKNVALCLDPATPPYELSLTMFSARELVAAPEGGLSYRGLIHHMLDLLKARGYRDQSLIMTPQEHALIRSTLPSGLVLCDPYKPLGVSTEALSPEETQKARALARKVGGVPGVYFNAPGVVTISLEPLVSGAETAQDPQVLDNNLVPIETSYSADFPFRREE